jgi:hypothetical protein
MQADDSDIVAVQSASAHIVTDEQNARQINMSLEHMHMIEASWCRASQMTRLRDDNIGRIVFTELLLHYPSALPLLRLPISATRYKQHQICQLAPLCSPHV